MGEYSWLTTPPPFLSFPIDTIKGQLWHSIKINLKNPMYESNMMSNFLFVAKDPTNCCSIWFSITGKLIVGPRKVYKYFGSVYPQPSKINIFWKNPPPQRKKMSLYFLQEIFSYLKINLWKHPNTENQFNIRNCSKCCLNWVDPISSTFAIKLKVLIVTLAGRKERTYWMDCTKNWCPMFYRHVIFVIG